MKHPNTNILFSNILSSILLAALVFVCAPSTLTAQPKLRGFQVPISQINQSFVQELVSTWKINLIRVQVGNDALMDGRTGQSYIDMMNDSFAMLDQALPILAANNVKMVFALYSPPGGFETRVSPSHYLMFSQASLQADFIQMWRDIMARYKDNSTIYAFDLVNEPAMRKAQVGPGAKVWNSLLLETITEIRKVAPSVKLMVKSLYGDPFKLSSLPPINDSNIIYSYHPYLSSNYQHSGVPGFSNGSKPTAEATKKKLLEILAKFTLRQKLFKDQKKGNTFPPVINAGEVAISACAVSGAEFLNDLLGVMERDDKKKKKRTKAETRELARAKARAKKKVKTFKDFISKVKHDSYTIHAYAEAEIWDPRYVCNADKTFTFSGNSTDRGIVLQSFFSRNK